MAMKPCIGCGAYLRGAGWSSKAIPVGAKLSLAHGPSLNDPAKPCPVKLAGRRGTRPADIRARGEQYINPIVSQNVAQSIDTTADVLGSSRGEIVSAGHALLVQALAPLDFCDQVKLVSCLARIVNGNDTPDDWLVVGELRKRFGESTIMGAVQGVAAKVRASNIAGR